jgi:O-antigen/teichoic acid export membrane protein
MLLIAGSLAVVSVLHLTHLINGGGRNGPSAAGAAEAVICLVMLAGARALARGRRNGRAVARATVIFAIAGFVVGLTFTLGSGDGFDIAYHLAGLTALFGTLALLGRAPEPR